jgi:hypothetical protein
MRRRTTATVLALGALALVAFSAVSYVGSSVDAPNCVPEEGKPGMATTFKDSVAALDKIIDLGLTFSTTLVGLGAALLMGWKTGIQLTYQSRLIILCATLFFVQSALYAITWRFWISTLLRIQCYEWLEEHLTRLIQMHLGFFFLGLTSLGVLVVSSFFVGQTKDVEDTTG